MDNTIKAVNKGVSNLIFGSAVATQNKVAQSANAKAMPVSVVQNNNFTTPTQTPYQIMLEQQKFSKNILKGVS